MKNSLKIMKKSSLSKIIEYGLYLFTFLMPLQARYFLYIGQINNGFYEYGTFSLYAIDILFLILFFLTITDLILKKQNFLKHKKFCFYSVAILMICASSIYWSESRMIAFFYFLRIFEGLSLIWIILNSNVKLFRLMVIFVITCFVQAVLGVFQFLFQSDIVGANKFLGTSSHYPGDLGTSVVEVGDKRYLRAYGTLPHPNILGGYLALASLFCFILYLKFQNKKEKIYFLLMFPFILMCLILTFSRSALLGLFVGGLFYLIFSYKKYKKIFLQSFSKFAFIGIMVLAMLFILYKPLFLSRLSTENRLENKSISERQIYFDQAKFLVNNNFWLGVGLGNHTYALFTQISKKWFSFDYQPVHNVYILLISELGIFAYIFIFFILYNLYIIFKNNKSKIFIFAVFFVLFIIGFWDHYLISLFPGIILTFFVFSLLIFSLSTPFRNVIP